MRSTSALAGDDVAGILVGATGVAIAGFASIPILGESPVLRQTLVAIARGDVTLARALAGHHVAALIVDGAQSVAGTGCNLKIINFFRMILENSLSLSKMLDLYQDKLRFTIALKKNVLMNLIIKEIINVERD